VVVGSGITGAPVHQVQRRIEGACRPGRPSPVLPRIAGAPRFGPRLTRRGHGPEAPRALTRLRVVRIEEPANAAFRAPDPDDDLVFDDEGRAGCGVIQRWIGNLLLPQHAPRTRVE